MPTRLMVWSLLAGLLSSSELAAQDRVGPASSASTIRWVAGSPQSGAFLFNGREVRVILTNGFTVMAFIESTDDPLRIQMYFRNATGTRLDIIPDNFSLFVEEVVPRRRGDRRRDELPKPLAYVSPAQIAKRIESTAAWAAIGAALGDSLGDLGYALGGGTGSTKAEVQTRDAYGRSTGSATITTKDQNKNKDDGRTAANIAEITEQAERQKIRETTGALLPNTLFSGQEFSGAIHFKRESRATRLLLRVPIGDRMFEFPLEMPRK